jgi:hypothetical protein
MVRVGLERHAQALARPHVRAFDMTGVRASPAPMAGWIIVEPEDFKSEQDLKGWIGQDVEFARSLPGK